MMKVPPRDITTNAMRILEKAKIPFETASYEYDESDLSGVTAACRLGVPPGQVFKTLVARGERRGVMVAMVPADCDIDLKALSAAAGDKRVEMCPLKDVTPLTGYIRGGVSPVGMKKKYPAFMEESALLFEKIYISAGQRGHQIVIDPRVLYPFIGATLAPLAKKD